MDTNITPVTVQPAAQQPEPQAVEEKTQKKQLYKALKECARESSIFWTDPKLNKDQIKDIFSIPPENPQDVFADAPIVPKGTKVVDIFYKGDEKINRLYKIGDNMPICISWDTRNNTVRKITGNTEEKGTTNDIYTLVVAHNKAVNAKAEQEKADLERYVQESLKDPNYDPFK